MGAIGRSLIGVGLYEPSEAARLLGVPLRKLRRWVCGYGLEGAEGPRISPGVIQRELAGSAAGELLTFLDLMELKFIAMFRQHGVSMQVVRAAAQHAARIFSTDHPFAVRRFDTDGKTIFATLGAADAASYGVSQSHFVQDLALSQYVFGHIVKPFFRRLDYEGVEIARYWPLGKSNRVVLDPRRAFGKPIDALTGVPTAALYRMWLGIDSYAAVARWYEVPRAAVRHAVEYEQALLAA